jgi:hypothetical protein
MVRLLEIVPHWSAREFENWMLFYSIPVLNNVLPDRYLKHWVLFVQGMHLLLSEKITEEDLNIAEMLITNFVKDIEVLYENRSNNLPCKQMTFNVHILLHLVRHVRNWGPLMCISSYAFEAGNGVIKRMVHANRGIPHQILRKFGQMSALQLLRLICRSPRVEAFRKNLNISNNPDNCFYIDADTKVCGKHVLFKPTDEQRWILEQHGFSSNTFEVYSKMILRHCCFTTSQNKSGQRNNSWVVKTDGEIVLLRLIAVDVQSNDIVIFASAVHTSYLYPSHPCIMKCELVEEGLSLLLPSDIDKICVSMDLKDNGHYLSIMPNIINVF